MWMVWTLRIQYMLIIYSHCSDDEIKIGEDEGKAHFEQVKLREKRKKIDPFADLLSPGANIRLRWSQELNPLYDYIRGFKISDGVKLYDTPSKLLESANASDLTGGHQERTSFKGTPSVIVEEESEYGQSSREQTCSPLDSSLYSPPNSRPTSSFNEVTTSISPTRRRPHLYEEVNLDTISQKYETKETKEPTKPSGVDILKMLQQKRSGMAVGSVKIEGGTRSATLNLGHLESGAFRSQEKPGRSPRIGKRELLQRRSRTLASFDDTEAVKKKQRPIRASDELKVVFSHG